MILNGIDIDQSEVDRYLKISHLPGGGNSSLKQLAYVNSIESAYVLPAWMLQDGMSYFGESSLVKENDKLPQRVNETGPWLAGNLSPSIYPGRVDPENLILIGGNFMEEQFVALCQGRDGVYVVVSEDVDGKFFWRKIFDSFGDFLDNLQL